MSLKNTVKKPSPEEIETKLRSINMSDKDTNIEPENNSVIKTKHVEETVKINATLPKSKHKLYKFLCSLEEVDMQVKTAELVEEWISKQPGIQFNS